ncbi:MAG: hypothetical protein QM775_16685 [Pirellulales bacterium]
MAAPTISGPANQSLAYGEALAAQPVTVGDDVTPTGSLVLTAESDDQGIVADEDIVLGGANANRSVALTPVLGAIGTATITLTVTDGGAATATHTFDVTVAARVAVDPFAAMLPSQLIGPVQSGEAITPHDEHDLATATRRIHVGGAGHLKVTLATGEVVEFKSLPIGIHEIRATRVWSTGTTATNLLALR